MTEPRTPGPQAAQLHPPARLSRTTPGGEPKAHVADESLPPPVCVAGQEIFADVPASHPLCASIQQLFRDGFTAGCGTGPLRFCPDNAVTRGQLAILLERVLQARSPRHVDAGLNHSCAVLATGRVVCWGRNDYGQAPPGPSADTFQSVSAGGFHSCGVRVDGKVVCWGYNQTGGAPPEPSLDTFQSVSAGTYHTCGVLADASVRCWGLNDQGQGPPVPSPDAFQSVSAGHAHSCGVRSDGKVVC